MRFQDVLAGIGMLILVYLLLANWKGANALLTTSASASISMVKALQGR
jgi:hypothetical protein